MTSPLSAKSFRRVAAWAWALQALIVLSGAAVRLTEAGLGCEDWPRCNQDKLLPQWEFHGLVEFGNRLISGLVAASAVVAVVAVYRLRPRRADLIPYAWGLVAGTAAQVVLGGITVLLHLHPIVVSVHFLLSMTLLWDAQTLYVRSGGGSDAVAAGWQRSIAGPGGDPAMGRLARLQLGLATAVLVTGTLVTGTGPNSGDSRADRLRLDLTWVARVHSAVVWLMMAAVIVIALRLARRRSTDPAGFTAVRWMIIAIAAQGAIGYTQFALGVPAALVEVHILGAVVVWSLSIRLHMDLTGRPAGTLAAGGDFRDPAHRVAVADSGA